MKRAGAITIGGSGCDANFEINVYFGDDELVSAGPACRMGPPEPPTRSRTVMNQFGHEFCPPGVFLFRTVRYQYNTGAP